MALLKVKISVARLAALMDALRPEPNEFQVASHSFQTVDGIPGYREKRTIPLVRILPGDRKFDGEDIEVSLELFVKYPDTEGDKEVVRDVPREVIDKLWDILGIFPHSGKLPEDVRALLADIHNAMGSASTTAEYRLKDSEVGRQIYEQMTIIHKAETDLSERLRQLL